MVIEKDINTEIAMHKILVILMVTRFAIRIEYQVSILYMYHSERFNTLYIQSTDHTQAACNEIYLARRKI